MTNTVPVATLDKSLSLLTAIVEDGGNHPFSELAKTVGLSIPTAYRIAGTLKKRGFLAAGHRGYYLPGPKLCALITSSAINDLIAAAGRPVMRELSQCTSRTAHLGVFEGDMVTYVVKASVPGSDLFTKEGMQLEAYCSAIGKVLLSELPVDERERYLSTGPFIQLTPRTITSPQKLRTELERVQKEGFAVDDAEVDSDLHCLAVPVAWDTAGFRVAISIASRRSGEKIGDLMVHLQSLKRCARVLENVLSASVGPHLV